MTELASLVEELGAALAAPNLPRLQRNRPGLDRKWRAGDLALQLPRAHIEDVAERLGISVGLLRSYADVARAYPPDQRTVAAAWTVYREVRILPPEDRQRILRDGLTLRAARIAIGKGPMDQPKRERQSDDDRAWAVIEELQVPRIRQIVMTEMESSTADRKARRAARSTLDEIAARKKFIETELRKQSQQPSPDRQYWLASKELNEAARFVYSVARLHDHHRGVMDDDRWEDIVKTLRSLADSAQDVADRIDGLEVDYIDSDEVDDLLELGSGTFEIVEAEIIGEE